MEAAIRVNAGEFAVILIGLARIVAEPTEYADHKRLASALIDKLLTTYIPIPPPDDNE